MNPKTAVALEALNHPALDPKLAARALRHPDPEVRLAAARSPSLPDDAKSELMTKGRLPAWNEVEAPLREALVRGPGATKQVVSMALDDPSPAVRVAPFVDGGKCLGLAQEHLDRVVARGEPAQVMAAASTPLWRPEHTKKLAARPDFSSKQLAERIWGVPAGFAAMRKAEDLAKMAISDIPPGKQTDPTATEDDERDFDYSHVLPPEHRSAGYRLDVTEHGRGGDMTAYLMHPDSGDKPVGSVRGVVMAQRPYSTPRGGISWRYVPGKPATISPHSKLDPAHRGKGLGTAMYEALFAHAYHKGVRTVHGLDHSSAASAVHRRLAAKHGLEYSPEESLDPEHQGVGPYEYELKSEPELIKAIGDIPVGKEVPTDPDTYRSQDYKTFDYSHVLTPEQRRAGYAVAVVHHKNGTLYSKVYHNRAKVGEFGGHAGTLGRHDDPKALMFGSSSLNEAHRGKGLGVAGYEAMFAHAKNALGMERVFGDRHTEKASRVHASLARRHGLDYEAVPLKGDWNPLNYHEPYEYELKSEPPLSKAEGDLQDARRAASFFGTEAPDHDERLRSALWEHDGDPEKAALAAHGAPMTEENLRALRAVRDLADPPATTEPEAVDRTAEVRAAFPEGREVAEGLARAFEKGFAAPVNLPGRNSAGSVVVRDQDGGHAWLLKKVRPRVEAAFWKVADRWGLGSWIAKVELVTVGGEPRAAVELQPWDWKNLDELRAKDPGAPARLFAPYLAAGVLHRLAFMDAVLGNEDRNYGNILVSPDKQRFRLIDEGNALVVGFDPGFDRQSYVPAYLRAWLPAGAFNSLGPEDKLKALPRLSDAQARELGDWLEGLDAKGMEDDLKRYGQDPLPVMERLAKLRAAAKAEPADLAINRFWVGA